MKVLYTFCAFLIIFFTACKKEVLYPEVALFKVADNHHTQAILALSEDTLLAAVGTIFTPNGAIYKSVDKGETWQLELNVGQAPMTLHQKDEGVYTVVFGNEFHYTTLASDYWEVMHLLGWGYWSDIAVNGFGKGIIVGGLNFAEGYIQAVDMEQQNATSDRITFTHELKAVCFADDSVAIAVGYGTILRSKDAGNTWQYLSNNGDFYRDVQFVNDTTAFIVGFNGAVLHSKDKGLTWKEISKPNTLSQKKRFKKAYFLSESLGWAAGENGKLWQTNNGGKDWTMMETKTNYDFNDIIYQAPYLYLATDEGYVLRVTL